MTSSPYQKKFLKLVFVLKNVCMWKVFCTMYVESFLYYRLKFFFCFQKMYIYDKCCVPNVKGSFKNYFVISKNFCI